jgi:general secretion pathway protein L
MSLTLPRPLPANAARLIGVVWDWWSGEIFSLMPASLTRFFLARQTRLIVKVERANTALYEEIGGTRRYIGSVDAAAEPGAAVSQRVEKWPDAATLELPAALALRRTIALPLAATANLAEVVSFELERYTPFRRTDVYHAWRAGARDDGEQQTQQVELTVVPRQFVDAELARLAQRGLSVGTVVVAAETAGASPSPNILPANTEVGGGSAAFAPRVAIGVLMLLAIALAAAAAIIPFARAERQAAQLEAALQSARQQAIESRRLQTAIEAARADLDFLPAHKRRFVPVSQLLDTLTRLLPDDTWLTELRISGDDLEIAGSGASASAIVERIDNAPGFSDAAFRSPVTPDQRGREQFDIGTRTKAGRR